DPGGPASRDGYHTTPGSIGGPVSADGRYVGFDSCSEDLVSGDTNDRQDYFVRDRGAAVGVGGLVASGRLSVNGASSFSSSGVVASVDPASDVDAALAQIGANLIGASVAYRSSHRDLFVRA